MPQEVDVQVFWQSVLFQNQPEPPGEGGGRHGKAAAFAAEQKVLIPQSGDDLSHSLLGCDFLLCFRPAQR